MRAGDAQNAAGTPEPTDFTAELPDPTSLTREAIVLTLSADFITGTECDMPSPYPPSPPKKPIRPGCCRRACYLLCRA